MFVLLFSFVTLSYCFIEKLKKTNGIVLNNNTLIKITWFEQETPLSKYSRCNRVFTVIALKAITFYIAYNVRACKPTIC